MTRSVHTAFSSAHPVVPACYLVFTLAFTMGSMQPALIAISLLGAFAYGCCVRGVRESLASLRWQLPFVLLVALVNPLFSAAGSTEVARFGVRAVYLESLAYGCAMGALFVASALWFQAAARMLSFDKVMALAGNAAPVVALMISMTMRLIPHFARRGRQVAGVQAVNARAAGAGPLPSDAGSTGGPRASRGGVSEDVRARLRLTSVLMGWGMEDSLETADAMRARGWGAARRTTYTRYRFSSSDAAALVGLLAGGCLCAVLAFTATSQFSFFPTVTRLVAWWGYLPYAAWMLLPALLHLREGRMFA